MAAWSCRAWRSTRRRSNPRCGEIRDWDSAPVKTCFAVGAVLRVCEVFRFVLEHRSLGVTLVLLLLVRAGSVISRRVFSPWPRGSRSGLNLRGGSVDSLRSVMSGLLDGRCLCGCVTYRCDGEPLVTVVCHCQDCQRQTGSAFSIFVVVPRATLHVGGDTLATYVTVGADSGEERQRQFCSKCGSPVVTLLTEQPELAVIKAGTLNDPSWLSPTLEVWCGSAQPWLAPIENSRRLARGLPA